MFGNFYFTISLAFLIIYEVSGQCWLRSYGRGVGSPLSACPYGSDKSGLLCYPPCRRDYYGVGPVCWSNCAPGYEDHGAVCTRWPHIKGKGCCCINIGFWKNGCCGNCPSGYRDDGCTCHRPWHTYAKSSYGRGVGFPMICAPGLEQNLALCYPKCKPGYSGIGPVCWAERCPGAMSFPCGLLCTVNIQQCKDVMKDVSKSALDLIVGLAQILNTKGGGDKTDATTDIINGASGIASALIVDMCQDDIIVPTYCVKKGLNINDKLSLSVCGNNNPFECGVFCTSSEMKCIKEQASVVPVVRNIVTDSPLIKDLTSYMLDFKNCVSKANKSSEDILNMIKKGKILFNSVSEINMCNDKLKALSKSLLISGEIDPTSKSFLI